MKKYEDAVFYYSASIAMFPTVAAFNNRAQSCEYFKHSHCLHLKTVRYWLTAYFWQWAIFVCVCFLGVTGCHIPTGKCFVIYFGQEYGMLQQTVNTIVGPVKHT